MSTKRPLTQSEIDYILSFITPLKNLPYYTAISLVEQTKRQMTTQLSRALVYPEIIPLLKQKMERLYFTSQIPAGESVGIIAAQSIGEKQTQSNLNNFHRAGSAENQTGTVSKFSELLNATRNPKSSTSMIYFKHGNTSISELRQTIGHSIVELNMKDIIHSFDVHIDKQPEVWYQTYRILHSDKFTQYKHCISLKINMDKLYEYFLTLQQVVQYFQQNSGFQDMDCVFSPDCYGQIDIFVNTENITFEDEKTLLFVTPENTKSIYLEEVVYPTIEQVQLCGIKGIRQMYFLREKDGKWMVETSGTNFSKLLQHPNIDKTRLISNNIWDIYKSLGIEAVREYMINEFSNIMEGVNMCHIMLLVDKMTYLGTISSISRYTVRTDDSGPFSKASFEETLDNFLKGGIFGERESSNGVSSSIICGKRSSVGTGLCGLKMDLTKLN